VGERCVALAVQCVVGVADLSDLVFVNLPPLLNTVQTELIQRLGTLDAEFLVMLDTARMVPESMWEALPQTKAML
jgi:chemotaxis signal transduction protein